MLNYETILSSYDDKLTLMQWLKKVEDALKDASATSFDVIKTGDATLKFAITFEDGTSLVSGDIILQQGESVQAAAIRNGHLILTLTNGDELDAGDLGGVSGFSINALQHLIVTYQNGTTQDLGAIFTGDVTVSGNLTASSFYGVKIEGIKDESGHDRFIGGNLSIGSVAGVNITYGKWYLNGAHLIIVIAGNIESGASLASSALLAGAGIPNWVLNKIVPVIGNYVMVKETTFYKPSFVTEKHDLLLYKTANNVSILVRIGFTASDNLQFRESYELLIDNE